MPELTWGQQPGESLKAYVAFVTYRGQGRERSLPATAQQVGKHLSLLKRWSARYRWRDRVFAWDISQAREAEEALRRQRQESLERQSREIDQLQRLAMARFAALVRRDAQTGENTLDPSITPRDALAILKFVVEQQDRLAQTTPAEPAEDLTERELRRMTTEQLHELLALVKERAGQDADEDKGEGDEQH